MKVLGTKFNVKAYSDDQEIAVTLAEGSVNMVDKAAPANSVIMVPQQQAVYNKLTGKTEVRKVSTDAICQWTTVSSLMKSVLKKSPDSWKSLRRNLHFPESGTSETSFLRRVPQHGYAFNDILTIMSSSEKFTYRRNNNIIEIY